MTCKFFSCGRISIREETIYLLEFTEIYGSAAGNKKIFSQQMMKNKFKNNHKDYTGSFIKFDNKEYVNVLYHPQLPLSLLYAEKY